MCSTEVLTDELRKREGARGPWRIAPGDATNDQGVNFAMTKAQRVCVSGFGDYVATTTIALAVAGCAAQPPPQSTYSSGPQRVLGYVSHAEAAECDMQGQMASADRRGSGNLRRNPQDVPAIQGLRAAEDHQAVGGREQPRLEPGAGRPEDRVTVGLLPASSWPRCSEELARSPTAMDISLTPLPT